MPTNHELRTLAHLRRARDAMDRDFASPLDVPTVARHALMSPAHFSREFKAAYGQSPHDYLVSRRVERAMVLLRHGASVTEACCAVGYTSLGSFVTRFAALTGETPGRYRDRDHRALDALPPCLVRTVARPVTPGRPGPPPSEDRAGSEKRTVRAVPSVRA